LSQKRGLGGEREPAIVKAATILHRLFRLGASLPLTSQYTGSPSFAYHLLELDYYLNHCERRVLSSSTPLTPGRVI
jgi:hypothetical protein